jgi:general secretion pathway protein L
MKVSDIFNAELSTIGQWIAQGWHWWLAEMAAMLPARLRRSGSARARAILLPPDGAHAGWRQIGADGAPTAPTRLSNAVVALPEGQVLTRALTLPALPIADLRRLVSLDIDRLTPFTADQVWTDLETGPRNAAGGIEATLGVVPRGIAETVLADAERAGISVGRLAARTVAGVRFDFLAAIRGRQGMSVAAKWWVAVALLFAVNIAMLAIRDAAAVARLREAVEAEAPAARTATALRNRVMAEQGRRVRLVRLRDGHDPLPVLRRVDAALPPGAWVMRMVWNGRTVRLVGYQAQGVDVLAALRRAPGFARVRTSSSDIAPEAGKARPFDVTADVRVGPAGAGGMR